MIMRLRQSPYTTRALVTLLLLLFTLLFGGQRARADETTARRIALVIGVSANEGAQLLRSPASDVELVSKALKVAGFETRELKEPNQTVLRQALQQLREDASKADIALVYFSGRGVARNGVRFLMPAGAGLKYKDVEDHGIAIGEALQAVGTARTLSMAIFGGCFDNPIDRGTNQYRAMKGFRLAGLSCISDIAANPIRQADRTKGFSLGRGRATESIVVYAAGERSFYDTDRAEPGSPFARAFAKRIGEPGDILRVMGRVSEDTRISTLGGETPSLEVTGLHGKPICLGRCDDTAIASNDAALKAAIAPHCDGAWQTVAANKEARYALVIGELAYQSDQFAPLSATLADAQNVRDGLVSAGFSVVTCYNLDFATFRDRTAALVAQLKMRTTATEQAREPKSSTTAFVYYSGHGVASATTKVNYLVPLGVDPKTSLQLAEMGIAVPELARTLTETGASAIFLVVDACRRTLIDNGQKAARQLGLLEENAPDGAFIAFAAGPGKVAPDDSLYSKTLGAALKKRPGKDARILFANVRRTVWDYSHNAQIPYNDDKLLIDEFHFQPSP